MTRTEATILVADISRKWGRDYRPTLMWAEPGSYKVVIEVRALHTQVETLDPDWTPAWVKVGGR